MPEDAKDASVNTLPLTAPLTASGSPGQESVPATRSAPADPACVTTLDAAAIGAPCALIWLRAEGVLGQRLADMGFFPGARVRVVRRAPLADPLEVDLDGVMVCIRMAEAAQVEVIPLDLIRREVRS